jgi:lysophospholipase L1-like esterase
VLAGTVPYQYKDGQCTFLSDEPCLAYTQEIEADVSLFAGDGLDVRLFDTHKYMYATAKEMSDALHPNALGQVELSHAVEAVW